MTDSESFERDVHELGVRIFELAAEREPGIFDSRWWSGKMIEASVRNPAFKTAMFRFVDVFPNLRSADAVASHIGQYFDGIEDGLPAALRWGVKIAGAGSVASRAAAAAARKNIEALAQRFIAGATPAEALPVVRGMWEDGTAFSADLLGEATLSRPEAEAYRQRYLDLLDVLSRDAAAWPPDARLEQTPWGALPRVNVSVKASALHWHLDPADFEGSVERLCEALHPIFRRAHELGAFVNLDVEQYTLKGITYAAFQRTLEQRDLEGFEHAGIVCQAYLEESLADLEQLAAWARGRDRTVTVRLVKGAYWDFEVVRSRQEGQPCPVFTDKAATDASFESCAGFLADHADVLRPAFGTHNVRSLAAALTYARRAGLPDAAIEVQMLYGMAESLKRAVTTLGYRVREYVPLGELIPGMAYLVRRLLENTSNEGFLRASFIEHMDRDALLAAPDHARDDELAMDHVYRARARRGRARANVARDEGPLAADSRAQAKTGGFSNEPHLDFTSAELRTRFGQAVADLDARIGNDGPLVRVPIWIDGREIDDGERDTSRDPADPRRTIADVARGSIDHADAAVAAARRAFEAWRDTPARERADVLLRAAAWLRARRDEVAALEIFEVGKPWREADADVCEAIDFLEYYGREMVRLGEPRHLGDVAGEENALVHEGRGVAVVIAPWNFPLAIPTGMTAAALVAGNSVILKPAEQSPAVAWKLVEALRAGGVPDGVLAFVPGAGEVVGKRLVAHRDVDLIAFTGSKDVGLAIVEEAARTPVGQRSVKRVIAEMGGKNAIIVDDDADLDEAVTGVVRSAFEYAGQKCSACSRAVVLDGIHDAFVSRLVEATRSLRIGPPREPSTQMGPIIDEQQYRSVTAWQQIAASEGEVVLQVDPPAGGWFVGPTIVTGIRPEHRVAREEIFGPVLAVMRASDFDEAITVANSTAYALTGGLYSRSPAHIERARREFRVGNLYVNRNITGAKVGRQPFGGSRMSGVGSKAGGPDYLLQFLEPRTITENTVRRGFSPDVG